MARPTGKKSKKQEFETISKTYMFFESDIEELEYNGYTAKQILRLGLYAMRNNPKMLERINKNSQSIEHQDNRMSIFLRKIYELENRVSILEKQ